MCRKHFHPTSSSVLFCVFWGVGWFVVGYFSSLSLKEKKNLRRTPQGGRQPICTMGNLQTQEKTTIERLTEEADQKKTLSKPAKTHHSHSWSCVSAPLTRLGVSLTTSPLGTVACAREAAELRKAPRRLLAKHREGIRASGSYAEGKCSLNRDAFFNSSRH